MTQQQDRPRIFSHITRSRFLHLEDALTPPAPDKPGKIRFFIGSYERGSGKPAITAYHFLDDADARVIMADLSWSRAVDIKDFKGSASGGQPVSRVLKVKGPTKGMVWFQISMGPGAIIGQGAVKPAGKPEVEVSIGLTSTEARKLALAVIEYMTAYRVTAILRPQATSAPPARTVDRKTGEIGTASTDAEALFGQDYDRELADHIGDEVGPVGAGLAPAPIAPAPQAQKEPPEDSPPAFYNLVNKALRLGILDHDGVATRIKAPGSWREKGIQLQAILAT